METFEQFTSRVKRIPLASIEASAGNPRGPVGKDASFQRLVASIDNVGILVPLVVRELPKPRDPIKYELVDGERRFLAATELRLDTVPAHILQTDVSQSQLRKLMFHLHMTREQWEALAQCKALAEMYQELDEGLRFDEKGGWAKRIADETGMGAATARDRIHVLAWPKMLKRNILAFDEQEPKRDIYSYVLAIEVSIVEPSLAAFPAFYDHGRPKERTANVVRKSLLSKTIQGIETGEVRNRDRIREISPLFEAELPQNKRRTALAIFDHLVYRDGYLYEDAKAEIETVLPEILREKPPKPQKVIASMRSLTQILEGYASQYIQLSAKTENGRRKMMDQFLAALEDLIDAASHLKDRL